VLRLALEGGTLGQIEAERIRKYREKYNVNDTMHLRALALMGFSADEFAARHRIAATEAFERYTQILLDAVDPDKAGPLDDERLLEHRAVHGISEEQHLSALDAIAWTQNAYEDRRVELLGSKLRQLCDERAAKQAELEAMDEQLQQNTRRLTKLALAGESSETQIDQLVASLHTVESEISVAQQRLHTHDERLIVAQEALDLREAELFEFDEAVRSDEAAVASKQVATAKLERRIERLDSSIAFRQQRLRLLAAESEAFPLSSEGCTLERSDEDDEIAAVLERVDEIQKERARFVTFHTDCIATKLSLSRGGQLVNTRIDDLWEEVQEKQVPQAEWRQFIAQRLLASPKRRLALSSQVGDVIQTVGNRLSQLCQIPTLSDLEDCTCGSLPLVRKSVGSSLRRLVQRKDILQQRDEVAVAPTTSLLQPTTLPQQLVQMACAPSASTSAEKKEAGPAITPYVQQQQPSTSRDAAESSITPPSLPFSYLILNFLTPRSAQ